MAKHFIINLILIFDETMLLRYRRDKEDEDCYIRLRLQPYSEPILRMRVRGEQDKMDRIETGDNVQHFIKGCAGRDEKVAPESISIPSTAEQKII